MPPMMIKVTARKVPSRLVQKSPPLLLLLLFLLKSFCRSLFFSPRKTTTKPSPLIIFHHSKTTPGLLFFLHPLLSAFEYFSSKLFKSNASFFDSSFSSSLLSDGDRTLVVIVQIYPGMMCRFENLFPVVLGLFLPSVLVSSFFKKKKIIFFKTLLFCVFCETTKRSLCIRSLFLVQFLFLLSSREPKKKSLFSVSAVLFSHV